MKKGSLFLLALGVLGAAAIHRLTHDRWSPESGASWPFPPEARSGEWTRWEAVPMAAPIRGVWGARPDSVWAWGDSQIIHWDGRAWSRVLLPSPFGLIDSMGGTADATWLRLTRGYPGPPYPQEEYWCDSGAGWRRGTCAGEGGAIVKEGEPVEWPELEHLSASRPRAVASPAPLVGPAFVRGWRVGRNELWATDYDGTVLGRLKDGRWTIGWTRSPQLPGISGIWLASETDGWAVVQTSIFRWDGRAWKPVLQIPTVLRGLWGTAPDDVWAVGDGGLIMHWDGRSWTESRRGGAANLTQLIGRGKNDVWAAGCSNDTAVLLHWNGRSWQRWDGSSNQLWFRLAAACPPLAITSDGRALAIVEDRVLSWGGGGPSDPAIRAPEPGPDMALPAHASIGVLVAAGIGQAWVLGGRAMERQPYGTNPFAIRLAGDGTPPEIRPLPGRGYVLAAWARGPDDVWAVGTNGLVLHFDGHFWTRQPTDTEESFIAVHGAGDTVWIAGADGTLLRRKLSAARGR